MNSKITISDFSPHLFWDVDLSKFSFGKNKDILIKNVLEYGELQDWNNLKSLYGRDEILKISMNLEELDTVALSFVSTTFNIDKKEFRSYDENATSENFRNYIKKITGWIDF